jgi:hypothetical protein
VLKKIQLNICPNPSCQKTFENLIIIHDKSKMPAEIFYGCPYCFFKLDPTATNVLKKIEKIIEVRTSCNLSSKKETISNCPHHFGYLNDHFSDSIIPKQCLECKKMSSCMIHNSNEANKIIKETM